jgi:hypothetical protein
MAADLITLLHATTASPALAALGTTLGLGVFVLALAAVISELQK